MQLELQNVWRPLTAVFLLGWLLALTLTARQDFNNLRVAPQQSDGSALPPAIISTLKTGTLDYASIADMFLMGTVEETTTAEITLDKIPETRLNLSLRGLFVSKGSQLSVAVIETGDKQPSIDCPEYGLFLTFTNQT